MILLLPPALADTDAQLADAMTRLQSTVVVQLTDTPSALDAPNLCATTPGADVCHVDGAGISCSRAAVAALIGLDPEARDDRPSVPLLYVLAHELAHLEAGDESSASLTIPVAHGPRAERDANLLTWIAQGGRQRAQEERADHTAATKLRAAIDAAPYGRSAEDRLASWYALASLATSAPDTAGCLGDGEVEIPPTPEHLKSRARTLVKAVRHAKEGTPLPVLLGTHPDWGTRLGAVSDAVLPAADRTAALTEAQTMRTQIELSVFLMDALRFQAAGLGDYYPQLTEAVRVEVER